MKTVLTIRVKVDLAKVIAALSGLALTIADYLPTLVKAWWEGGFQPPRHFQNSVLDTAVQFLP